MKKSDNIAWAAGLFEGEGTLFLTGQTGSPCAALSMTDEDVVRRFARIIGKGQIGEVIDPRPQCKPLWTWRLGTKADIGALIELLYPYLGERRRAKADEVLVVCQQPKKKRAPVSAATRLKMSQSAKRRRMREHLAKHMIGAVGSANA
jgi:hypothetical protein